MKRLFFIVILFSFTTCTELTKQNDKKYFEGFVEFKLSFSSRNNEVANNLKKNYGTKVITYINSKGFFSREFIDSNNVILWKEVYRPDSFYYYSYSTNSDTIYRSDVRKDEREKNVNIQIVSPVVILDQFYPGCTALNKYVDKRTGSIENYYATYYFDSTHLLNPAAYKNAIRGGYEKVFSKFPYLTVGFTQELENRFMIQGYAMRVVETKIDDLHFEIPGNKIIIEQD